jgi:YVTN family beta-propeller protein
VYAGVRSSAVGVFDCNSNVMIAKLATSGTPVALVYDSVGEKVYTANGSSGTVSVIAGERPAVITEINACSWASAICLSTKENRVYCADQEGNEVAVIDASTNSVIARVSVGNEPSALSYDSSNNYVYCACRGSNDVYLIDSHRDNVVTHIDVGAQPFALAWNPFTLRTYVPDYLGSSVSVLRDSLHPGVEEDKPQAASLRPQATIVRGVLVLGAVDSRQNVEYRAELLNTAGRKVVDLHSGENDVSKLSPGVYFIREGLGAGGEGLGKTRKVVVTR